MSCLRKPNADLGPLETCTSRGNRKVTGASMPISARPWRISRRVSRAGLVRAANSGELLDGFVSGQHEPIHGNGFLSGKMRAPSGPVPETAGRRMGSVIVKNNHHRDQIVSAMHRSHKAGAAGNIRDNQANI